MLGICFGLSCGICRARRPHILCLLLWPPHSRLRIGTYQSPPLRLYCYWDMAYKKSFGCPWRRCWARRKHRQWRRMRWSTSPLHTLNTRLSLSDDICQARKPRIRCLWLRRSLRRIGSCQSPPQGLYYSRHTCCMKSFGCT